MGETLPLFTTSFNRSLFVESRPERLTKYDRIWTAEDVAEHFEEAFRTLRKLPPVKVQGVFRDMAGHREDQPGDRLHGA